MGAYSFSGECDGFDPRHCTGDGCCSGCADPEPAPEGEWRERYEARRARAAAAKELLQSAVTMTETHDERTQKAVD